MNAAKKDHRVAMVLKRAKDRVGCGWAILSPDLRHALICQEAIGVVAGQASASEAVCANLIEFASAVMALHEETRGC